jgi:hypothetical protein
MENLLDYIFKVKQMTADQDFLLTAQGCVVLKICFDYWIKKFNWKHMEPKGSSPHLQNPSISP